MIWLRRIWLGIIVVSCLIVLQPQASVQAFGPYKTLYVTQLDFGASARYEFSYDGGDIQNHALTFNATAGELLTIEAQWLTGGDPNSQPWINVVNGIPPVAAGSVYIFDYEAAHDAGDIMPDVMRADERIEDWEVPRTATYTLSAGFYPWDPGTYSLSFARRSAAPEQPEGWMGEFPQLEGGDHYADGTISSSQTWQAHSFVANPGDMLSIMAWTHDDVSADGTGLRLGLCQGGCDLDGADALVADFGANGVTSTNYQVPNNVPAGTLYTALLSGDGNTGDYSIWMRKWSPDTLIGQFAGGVSGELTRVEGGTYRMDGVISTTTAFQVHSFLANPGDTIFVRVTAKRQTPADELIPLVLLVPGGYVPGEQWLAMDNAADTTATIAAVTIPSGMPANMLYTVVVADNSNAGQLLFNTEAVFGYGGGYTVEVAVN